MGTTKLRGINYFYEDLHTEKQDTVLFVHGHPFDHSMWQYQVDALAHFRMILPDLRGYGKTDHDFEKIKLEEQVLDLVSLLDQLGIGQVHLLGLSMGGQIIVEFARLYPDRVRSLIICNSNPGGETPASYKSRLELIDQIIKGGMQEYTRQDIYKYMHPASIEAGGEAYQHLFSMMEHTTVQGAVAAHLGRAERRDNFGFLQQINFPTFIIGGDQDFFTPAKEMEQIAAEIKHAEFLIIKNAGHLPNMEQPGIFNQAIVAFLEKQH